MILEFDIEIDFICAVNERFLHTIFSLTHPKECDKTPIRVTYLLPARCEKWTIAGIKWNHTEDYTSLSCGVFRIYGKKNETKETHLLASCWISLSDLENGNNISRNIVVPEEKGFVRGKIMFKNIKCNGDKKYHELSLTRRSLVSQLGNKSDAIYNHLLKRISLHNEATYCIDPFYFLLDLKCPLHVAIMTPITSLGGVISIKTLERVLEVILRTYPVNLDEHHLLCILVMQYVVNMMTYSSDLSEHSFLKTRDNNISSEDARKKMIREGYTENSVETDQWHGGFVSFSTGDCDEFGRFGMEIFMQFMHMAKMPISNTLLELCIKEFTSKYTMMLCMTASGAPSAVIRGNNSNNNTHTHLLVSILNSPDLDSKIGYLVFIRKQVRSEFKSHIIYQYKFHKNYLEEFYKDVQEPYTLTEFPDGNDWSGHTTSIAVPRNIMKLWLKGEEEEEEDSNNENNLPIYVCEGTGLMFPFVTEKNHELRHSTFVSLLRESNLITLAYTCGKINKNAPKEGFHDFFKLFVMGATMPIPELGIDTWNTVAFRDCSVKNGLGVYAEDVFARPTSIRLDIIDKCKYSPGTIEDYATGYEQKPGRLLPHPSRRPFKVLKEYKSKKYKEKKETFIGCLNGEKSVDVVMKILPSFASEINSLRIEEETAAVTGKDTRINLLLS